MCLERPLDDWSFACWCKHVFLLHYPVVSPTLFHFCVNSRLFSELVKNYVGWRQSLSGNVHFLHELFSFEVVNFYCMMQAQEHLT